MDEVIDNKEIEYLKTKCLKLIEKENIFFVKLFQKITFFIGKLYMKLLLKNSIT